jgi:hypothetical protein
MSEFERPPQTHRGRDAFVRLSILAFFGAWIFLPVAAEAAAFDDGGVYRFMETNDAMMRDGRNDKAMAEGEANKRVWEEIRRRDAIETSTIQPYRPRPASRRPNGR